MSPTTRRDLLTGVTTIMPVPLLPVPAPLTDNVFSDGALTGNVASMADPALALYSKWKAVHEEHVAALHRQDAADEALFAARDAGLATEQLDAASDAAWDAVSELCGLECDIEHEIALTRATSWRGIAVKISLAARTTRKTNSDEPADVADHLVQSADGDLARLASIGAL